MMTFLVGLGIYVAGVVTGPWVLSNITGVWNTVVSWFKSKV